MARIVTRNILRFRYYSFWSDCSRSNYALDTIRFGNIFHATGWSRFATYRANEQDDFVFISDENDG